MEDLEQQLRDAHKIEIVTDDAVRSIQRKLDKIRTGKNVELHLREIRCQLFSLHSAERDRARKLAELDEKIDEERSKKKVKVETGAESSKPEKTKDAEAEAGAETETSVEDCVVCQQAVNLSPWTSKCLFCNKKYHMGCFNRWMSIRTICPHCQAHVHSVDATGLGIIPIDHFIAPLGSSSS